MSGRTTISLSQCHRKTGGGDGLGTASQHVFHACPMVEEGMLWNLASDMSMSQGLPEPPGAKNCNGIAKDLSTVALLCQSPGVGVL
jgi:hypothetical protein